MENRFGIKDLFLFLFLGALIVRVWLAMVQYDRQWDEIQAISARLEKQTTDLRNNQDAQAGAAAVSI